LDTVLHKVGTENMVGGSDYDKLVSAPAFQQEIQFLANHGRTGQFVEQYGDDGKYEGEFLYGQRHGKGRHEFRGEVYEGEWKWDKRHGQGILTLKDGSTINGGW